MIDSPISQPLSIDTRLQLDANQPSNIYRFKLSKQLTDIIERFAIVHRDDDTDDFKEAWSEFCDQNADILDEEHQRLDRIGCKQDFHSKIYTSARYYYKNKSNEDSPANNVTKQREYNKTSAEKLLVVDCFIKKYVTDNINHKPEIVYNEFVKEKGPDYVSKKVFKNKLYVFVRKNLQQQQENALQLAGDNYNADV